MNDKICNSVKIKRNKKIEVIKEKIENKGATQGLPRGSPILVLLSPKHAKLRSSDGIRCISAGMIAPDM